MALVADTVPTDDGEGWADALDEPLEVRADGMRETTLLTYAYYAPWVQITQLSAAKLAAKVRVARSLGRALPRVAWLVLNAGFLFLLLLRICRRAVK
jgi:hypothetical protein